MVVLGAGVAAPVSPYQRHPSANCQHYIITDSQFEGALDKCHFTTACLGVPVAARGDRASLSVLELGRRRSRRVLGSAMPHYAMLC